MNQEKQTRETAVSTGTVTLPCAVAEQALEAIEECDEILRTLSKNIEQDGHYSIESTLGFLNQARPSVEAITTLRQALEAAETVEPVEWQGLTDEEVKEALTRGVKAGELSWLGYKKDDQGKYTIPVLSKADYQAARVIEQALREKNRGVK